MTQISEVGFNIKGSLCTAQLQLYNHDFRFDLFINFKMWADNIDDTTFNYSLIKIDKGLNTTALFALVIFQESPLCNKSMFKGVLAVKVLVTLIVCLQVTWKLHYTPSC